MEHRFSNSKSITYNKNIIKLTVRKNKELFFCLAVLWFVFIILLFSILRLTDGHIVYNLDDAYIHMATAKNFSQYGVWGVSRFEFSSACSSLLYPLLLSLIFFIIGPNELIPLIINLFFAHLIIVFFYYIFKIKYNFPSYMILIVLLSAIFFIPLPLLIFNGMEHTMQVFINIVYVYLASEVLSNNNLLQKKNNYIKMLFVLAPFTSMVRFEGLFIIFSISLLFLFRRKINYCLLNAFLGSIPIVIFGIISISFGSFFFPNSIVLKSQISNLTSINQILKFIIGLVDFEFLLYNPHVLILLLAASLILYYNVFKKKQNWNKTSIIAIIFIIISLSQYYFGIIYFAHRNFSRYDAHIVAIGILMIFLSLKEALPLPQHLSIEYIKNYITELRSDFENHILEIISVIMLGLFVFLPFIYRAQNLIEFIPESSNNIYEQQYQMGLFLQKYYEGECVAAYDIGAINYIGDIECLDLRGLGSHEIAGHILKGDLDTDLVEKIAESRDCKIAIIYEDKDYGFDIPSSWTKVGEWKIENNVICGDDTVSFWAVDPDETDDLMQHLRDFSRFLPNTVIESGNYTK